MKRNKFLITGILIGLLILITAFLYLWSLGIFSGSAGIGPRNQVMEAAVTQELNSRLTGAFDEDSGFSLVSVKSYAAIYSSRFPEDQYNEKTEISAEDIDKAIYQEHNNITIEITFQGERLKFNEYKVFVYKTMETIKDKMEWNPLSMQVFYERYPEDKETKNVLEYESKIPNYLFDKDQGTVVNSSGTHSLVELDNEMSKKTTAYFTTKYIYLTVLSITVIGLSALFIVRTIRKRKRNN